MNNTIIEYNKCPVVVGGFTCTLCKTKYDNGGVLLDRGGGRLEVVCPVCANNYLFALEFVLPASFGGANNTLLYIK